MGNGHGLLADLSASVHAHLERAQVQHAAETELRGGDAVSIRLSGVLEDLVALAVLELEGDRRVPEREVAPTAQRQRPQMHELPRLVNGLVRRQHHLRAGRVDLQTRR